MLILVEHCADELSDVIGFAEVLNGTSPKPQLSTCSASYMNRLIINSVN